jgi:hypothetical protein
VVAELQVGGYARLGGDRHYWLTVEPTIPIRMQVGNCDVRVLELSGARARVVLLSPAKRGVVGWIGVSELEPLGGPAPTWLDRLAGPDPV